MSESKHPISIIDFKLAIKDLSEGELKTIKQRLHSSILRLSDSNGLMQKLLNKQLIGKQDEPNNDNDDLDLDEYDNVSDGDVELFKESIGENEKVIDNQRDRIEAIDLELSYRGSRSINNSTHNSSANLRAAQFANGGGQDNDTVDSTAPNSIFI